MDDLQAGTFTILFAGLCVRIDDFVMELAHRFLQPTMALIPQDKFRMMFSSQERKQHQYLLVIGAVVALR
jgi:hypothetical protein